MSIIPQDVLDLYDTFTDHFLDDFGTNCSLVYASQIEVVTDSVPDAKQKKTINMIPTMDAMSRGSVSYRSEEVTESIRLRIYWTQEEFKKISSVVLPEGSIAAYGKIEDLYKVKRASTLIIYANSSPFHEEWRCKKRGEPIIHGLTDKEFISIWERI